MYAGLEGLKVISCWEDGRRKRVPASRCHSHRDKRIGECVFSVSIQFKRVGVLNLRKSRISRLQKLSNFILIRESDLKPSGHHFATLF